MDVEIIFNYKIESSGVKFTWINETNTNLSIIPALNRHMESSFNLSDLNFTWKTTNITKNKMYIKLNFSDHSKISPLSK